MKSIHRRMVMATSGKWFPFPEVLFQQRLPQINVRSPELSRHRISTLNQLDHIVDLINEVIYF